VERALLIVEYLDENGEQGINEISRGLLLEKSTVHRLVSTLKNLGYLIQNPATKKYANSFKFFEIGNGVVKRLGLRKQAQPFMRDLSEKTKEAVNLAIMDREHVVYIDKIESPSTFKIDLAIGKKMPSYCTGLGKVLLASMEESCVRDLFKDRKLERFTENTITDIDDLIKNLRRIKSQGYCIDDEEYIAGLLCVAAPVLGHAGEPVAAISVALPKFRYDEKEIEPIVEAVKAASEGLSRELGYSL